MFSRIGIRGGLWALALILGVSAAACDSGIGSEGRNETETEGCGECQAILVECTSTSQDEQQFVGCRDQWQECQQQKGLGPDMCGNPNDSQACGMCQERRAECAAAENADEAVCDAQFGVCKAFLITRGDVQQQCTKTAEPTPDQVGCGICREDLATCASDPSGDTTMAVCSTKFGDCLTAHQVDQADCSEPAGTNACELCVSRHASCSASGDPSCRTGFDLCKDNLGTADCNLPEGGEGGGGMGEGGGGQGGGGQGGGGQGGGTGPNCSGFDGCTAHPAVETPQTCNACTDAVCTDDDYCCLTKWDVLCVNIAETKTACGCTIST